MLVHICCSVDSHFFLQKLREAYPDEPLIGFFYDPNIHPYDEYRLRLLDVRRSCRKLGIVLWEGSYDYEAWINAVRGLEHEPEKGKRCNVCFDNRLEESAKKALELGEKIITTTLLTSPKKSLQQLEQALETIAQKYGLAIVVPDFRKDGGTQAQFALARDAMLYHQNYCGCVLALAKQREHQKRFADEVKKYNQFFGDFEQVKRYQLVPEEWTQPGGFLSPTLKIKRNVIEAHYADRIEKLFA